MPSIVLLAAVLVAEGVSFVLVGSAALRLRGAGIAVGDVDVVPDPGDTNLERLHAALVELTVDRRTVPSVPALRGLDIVGVDTVYGRLDCLLERGRWDWDRLCQGAGPIEVADIEVVVASAADAWALRRTFKD